MGDADVVALGHRGRSIGTTRSDQLVEHALDDAAIHCADHRVLDDGIAERAVLGDDLELVAVDLFGPGGKSVGGQGIGDGMERTLE